MFSESPGDPLGELSLIEHKRTCIDREVDRLLGQLAQPAGGSRRRKRIRRKLRRLTGIRSRLDDEEAELRRRESDLLRIYHGRHPAGSTASSSRETGVEEHAGEVSNNDLRVTSTDMSEFGTLMLNDDTSCTLESASRVEEHAGEVRSSEPAGTSTDLSKFEALSLNDTPHIPESAEKVEVMLNDTPHVPESANRVVVHVDTIETGVLDSTIAELSALESKKPSYIAQEYWPPENEGDISYAEREAEKEYEESQAQLLQARGQFSYASKKEIARYADKWMREELMVAFKRYIDSEDDLKGIEYEFEEILDQCFNVENYLKIFHHFNFTVKIKKCGSADWTHITFFAEVISILETKYYVCYPLKSEEEGHCYACRNQGKPELRHPSVDIFDRGNQDTTFPYYYENSDSDESYPEVGESESDNDMS